MKNFVAFIIFLFCRLSALSQWSYETVNNGFDDPYRIAYTREVDGAMLKLENVDGMVYFYIQGSYTCEDYPLVEIICVVGGENRKYSFVSTTSEDRTVVFISEDLENSGMLADFKNASLLKLRINETYCDSAIFSFNMSKSSSAFNFINTSL
jgi:hypothetical protein